MDSRGTIQNLFGVPRALIGMIHVGALPGSPESSLSLPALVDLAVSEARLLHEAGFHGLMIENMHDRPYLPRTVGPETVAAMAAIGREVRRVTPLPLGVQVLAGANREALAVALACGATFIRAEGFVFAHVGDEGWLAADAGELLRYRRSIGAGDVRIFADIKKKHSAHTVTADVGLADTAHAAEFFLADGVIVTGTATGRAADPAEVSELSAALGIPTLVGSGITPENLATVARADGFIVGSFLKRDGLWSNPMEASRLTAMVGAFERMVPV